MYHVEVQSVADGYTSQLLGANVGGTEERELAEREFRVN